LIKYVINSQLADGQPLIFASRKSVQSSYRRKELRARSEWQIRRQQESQLGDGDDAAVYRRIIIDERNVEWLPALKRAFDIDDAVVGVGAAHLAGAHDLLTLQARDRYIAEPIVCRCWRRLKALAAPTRNHCCTMKKWSTAYSGSVLPPWSNTIPLSLSGSTLVSWDRYGTVIKWRRQSQRLGQRLEQERTTNAASPQCYRFQIDFR